MSRSSSIAASASSFSKVRDVLALFKLRLSALVVFSAGLGFMMGSPIGNVDAWGLLLLVIAGTLVTGASNAFNQVVEADTDALMQRTSDRPMVRRRLKVWEAVALAGLAGGSGVYMLWAVFGPLTAILGLLSLFMYVALYTPLKRHSAWSVFVGAFPGAFPPMLGYVAATGQFGLGPGLLFAMQFMWQFPHFWAIAWVLNDDYNKAGLRMLPSRGGRDGQSAFLILLYTLFVIPTGMLPWVFGLTGIWSMIAAVAAGALMLWPSFRLLFRQDVASARQLMFASFVYLPVVQIAYVLDRT
ncbi:MAG: heme o synthase [Flavobacteriales bacterium]|nr:heme o synthase [Flavobacteriales bacterium]